MPDACSENAAEDKGSATPYQSPASSGLSFQQLKPQLCFDAAMFAVCALASTGNYTLTDAQLIVNKNTFQLQRYRDTKIQKIEKFETSSGALMKAFNQNDIMFQFYIT